MKTISTPKAPAAIGPYSQAKVVNGMLYASGQIPINPATGDEMPQQSKDRQSRLSLTSLLFLKKLDQALTMS